MSDDESLLRRAAAVAGAARDHGNHPFGSLLADADGNVVLEAEVVYALAESALADLTGPDPENTTLRLPCREVFARGQRAAGGDRGTVVPDPGLQGGRQGLPSAPNRGRGRSGGLRVRPR